MDIILPVHNAAPILPRVVKTVQDYLDQPRSGQAIFVDDGSTDETATLLQELIKDDPRLSAVIHPVNRGKGAAIHSGATRCQGDYICFIDGDLAYSLDHLDPMREKLRDYDIVIGSRHLVDERQKNITFQRRLMGASFNWYVRLMLGLPYRDTQAGLKGFTRAAALDLLGRQRLTRFAFDVELLYLARSQGYRVAEIPATVSEEHSYRDSSVQLIRDPIRMFWSVLRVRFNALKGRYGSACPTELRRRGV